MLSTFPTQNPLFTSLSATTMAKPKNEHFNNHNFQTLLKKSETFLQTRNFTWAHKLALLAQQSDPTHHAPPILLAISSILKSPPSDHYSILNLPPLTTNLNLIKTHFHNLKSLLNPPRNPSFPFASEAYGVVVKSWSVLSDPEKKSRFDMGFDSFWTICPYCYNVYEYLKVYEDCCLRCQNGKCGRVFHGVALGQCPPEEVVVKGEYSCNGFVVLGGEKEANGWSPFSVLGCFPCGKKEEEKGGEFVTIEISDDEDLGNVEKNVENMEVDCGGGIEGGSVMGKGGIGGEKSVGCGGGINCGGRIKKSVPRNSRKIMGKGVRVRRDEVQPMQGFGDLGCGDGDMNELLNVGGETGGLAFDYEDDDILVGLQDVVGPTL